MVLPSLSAPWYFLWGNKWLSSVDQFTYFSVRFLLPKTLLLQFVVILHFGEFVANEATMMNLINMFLYDLLTHNWMLYISVQITSYEITTLKNICIFSWDLVGWIICCHKMYILSVLSFARSWIHDLGFVLFEPQKSLACYSSGQPRRLWRFFAIGIVEKLCSRGQSGGLFITLLQIASRLSNAGTGSKMIEWKMEKT